MHFIHYIPIAAKPTTPPTTPPTMAPVSEEEDPSPCPFPSPPGVLEGPIIEKEVDVMVTISVPELEMVVTSTGDELGCSVVVVVVRE